MQNMVRGLLFKKAVLVAIFAKSAGLFHRDFVDFRVLNCQSSRKSGLSSPEGGLLRSC